MRKKILSSIVAFTAFLGLLGIYFSPLAEAASTNEQVAKTNASQFIKAISSKRYEFDLTKIQKQERIVYDKSGKKLGVIGVEPVKTDINGSTSKSTFSALGVYNLGQGYSTWKIYWYSVSVNFSYYIDIYVNSLNKGTILRAYNPWRLITPPYTVQSEKLAILRATEYGTQPANARYTLSLTSLWGGTWDIYLYSELLTGKLYTGTN